MRYGFKLDELVKQAGSSVDGHYLLWGLHSISTIQDQEQLFYYNILRIYYPKQWKIASKTNPQILAQMGVQQLSSITFSIIVGQNERIILEIETETKNLHATKPVKKSTGRWVYGTGKTTPSFKIATWNVNGIRSAKPEVQAYIRDHAIDILCINQSKIDEATYDQKPIEIHGFSAYWNFCKVSSGYSGVAIFSKFLPIRMEEDLPQIKHQHEGRLITLEFQKFYLIAVYCPNSGSQQQRLAYRVNQWDIDFKKHCQQLREKKNVIICGDLNVVRDEKDIHMAAGGVLENRKMPGCNLQERNNMQSLLKGGWIDTWREQHPTQIKYTWWNLKIKGRKNGIGWRIDYILVNQQMRQAVSKTNIHEKILGSDHCPVDAVINLDKAMEREKVDKVENVEKVEKVEIVKNHDQEDEVYNEGKKKMDTVHDVMWHFMDACDAYDDGEHEQDEDLQGIDLLEGIEQKSGKEEEHKQQSNQEKEVRQNKKQLENIEQIDEDEQYFRNRFGITPNPIQLQTLKPEFQIFSPIQNSNPPQAQPSISKNLQLFPTPVTQTSQPEHSHDQSMEAGEKGKEDILEAKENGFKEQ